MELPGRPQRGDAGGGTAAANRGDEEGDAAVPDGGAVGRSGDDRAETSATEGGVSGAAWLGLRPTQAHERRTGYLS